LASIFKSGVTFSHYGCDRLSDRKLSTLTAIRTSKSPAPAGDPPLSAFSGAADMNGDHRSITYAADGQEVMIYLTCLIDMFCQTCLAAL
jgi:hypothetical protein